MTTDSTEQVLTIPIWCLRQYGYFKENNIEFTTFRPSIDGTNPAYLYFDFYPAPTLYPNPKKNPDNLLTGINTSSDIFKELFLFKDNFRFYPRNKVETDTTRIQLIPYFTINLTMPEQKSESSENIEHYSYRPKLRKILSYSRSNKSGESRLHEKRSIGFGGHINDLDHAYALKQYSPEMVFYNTIRQGLNRELSEELSIDWNNCDCHTMYFKGLIYDPTTDVGKVHLGIVFELSFSCNGSLGTDFDKYIKLKDNSNKNSEWLEYISYRIPVLFRGNNYETWSILCCGFI